MDNNRFEELIPYEACPLCGSKDFSTHKRADCSKYPHFRLPLSPTLTWMKCSVCMHSFRDGFYTEQAFAILFEKTHPNQTVGYDYERQRTVWARVIEKVVPHQRSGLWVDVGFGNGALLLTAAEFGFEPFGIDLRERNVADLHALGVACAVRDFAQTNVEPRASVISMCDVLEHMQFPLKSLASAHRNLQVGGVLLLSMPNQGSPVWQLLDRAGQNPYWGEMEHFHNFSKQLIEKILSQVGFLPVAYGVSERYRACMDIIAVRK